MTRANVIDDNKNWRVSTWFLEDASFLRVKNVQFGISIPSNWANSMNIQRMRVYANASNLFTSTKYRGYDPEVGGSSPLRSGIDNGTYPVPRSFTFGLQMDF
jgi:hypothetical protein